MGVFAAIFAPLAGMEVSFDFMSSMHPLVHMPQSERLPKNWSWTPVAFSGLAHIIHIYLHLHQSSIMAQSPNPPALPNLLDDHSSMASPPGPLAPHALRLPGPPPPPPGFPPLPPGFPPLPPGFPHVVVADRPLDKPRKSARIRYRSPDMVEVEDVHKYVLGGYHPVDIGDTIDEFMVIHKLGSKIEGGTKYKKNKRVDNRVFHRRI